MRQQLGRYRITTSKYCRIEKEAIFESAELRKKHSLLTNDSLNLYAMKANKLRYIATNDSDFDRVEWITVWKPELIDFR